MADSYLSKSAQKRKSLMSIDNKSQSDIVAKRIDVKRPQPRVYYKSQETSDEENEEAFTASPADDIPKNRLTEKLVRGLQNYIQRMQKRESFRIDVKNIVDSRWMPAPRECATLTACGYKLYLLGGLNFDTSREVIQGKIIGDSVSWEKVPYTSSEAIAGRQCHTSVAYGGKIFTFGGCFMFNRKR